jgi:6-phosphogluconolactonase
VLVQSARDGAEIALSGGSTPRTAYELAAEAERDWGRASIWLVDERHVPLDDLRSNARLVRETILSRLEAQPRTHFVRTDLSVQDAADGYDRELRGAKLELIMLGIGPDGHTASLFSHAESLAKHERLAVAVDAGLEPFVPRVTMTLRALNGGEHVVFLVTGADKADAVRRAFVDEPSEANPASLVRPEHGKTTAILDAAAASRLG